MRRRVSSLAQIIKLSCRSVESGQIAALCQTLPDLVEGHADIIGVLFGSDENRVPFHIVVIDDITVKIHDKDHEYAFFNYKEGFSSRTGYQMAVFAFVLLFYRID